MDTTESCLDETTQTAETVMVDTKALTVLTSCHSLTGPREENQDVAAVQQVTFHDRETVTVGCVADGMGGHADGKVAANEAVLIVLSTFITGLLVNLQTDEAWDIPDWLAYAVDFANGWIMDKSKNGEFTNGMGTTLVAAVIYDNTLYLANVGDSRAYLMRHGELKQLTRDDSFVQGLVDKGYLSPEETEHHPRANEITRALGWPDALDDFAVTSQPVEADDIVLLCSDGLWKGSGEHIQIGLKELSERSIEQKAVDEAVQTLVEDALERGADDNISAALLWVAPATNGDDKTQGK